MNQVASFTGAHTRGFLHEAANGTGDALLLTHGAGGNCNSKLLVLIAEEFARAGVAVLRYDLPFRQERKSGPPRGNAASDRKGIADALNDLRAQFTGRIYLGGLSYGGRQASVLAAENHGVCDGLLLLSYPLHPPAQPQTVRTAHFPCLVTSVLFVHGTRDPFGSVEEMQTETASIRSEKYLAFVEGAGHDLKAGRFDVRGHVVDRFLNLAGLTAASGKTKL